MTLLAAEIRDEKGKSTPLAEQCDRGAGVAAFWCCVALTGQRVVQLLEAKEEGEDLLVLTDPKGRGAKPKRHALPLTPRLKELWKLGRGAKTVNTFTVRGAANSALKKIAPGAAPLDIRRTVETVLKDAGVSREDRAELLSHGRTGIQAAHYERTDYIPQKLAALHLLEAWVIGGDSDEAAAAASNVIPMPSKKSAA